jgi:tRNA(adenine34) deaminase
VGSNPTPSAMSPAALSPDDAESTVDAPTIHEPIRDETLMGLALDQARLAVTHGDVPVGAVIVHGGVVIAARHNERELHHNPVAHAEVLALQDAAAQLGQWRLDECTMYVTLEPCAMCAGAAVNARLGQLVFGATDPKAGAIVSVYQLTTGDALNHRVEVRHGVKADDSAGLLRAFFQARR